MPLARALFVGPVNAFGSIIAQPIPSTPAAIAVLNAETICGTLLESEPVQLYVQPSSEHASEAPYCVGVKNGFVVTWLTSVNLRAGSVPKIDPGVPANFSVAAKADTGCPSVKPASAPARGGGGGRGVRARALVWGVSVFLESIHSRR